MLQWKSRFWREPRFPLWLCFMEKNDHIYMSHVCTPWETSRKNYPIGWYPIHMPSKSSRKNDHIYVWPPIRRPLASSTRNDTVLDITKARNRIERDKNGSITPQLHQKFWIRYNDLIKSEDTSKKLQCVFWSWNIKSWHKFQAY